MPTGDVHEFPEPMHDLVATVAAPACALGDPNGQIRPAGVQGLYVADARVLRAAHLLVAGREPVGLGWSPDGPNSTRFEAVVMGIGDVSPDPTVRVIRVRTVRPDGLTEEIRIMSTAQLPVRTVVTLRLEPDLTPLTQARSGRSSAQVSLDTFLDSDGGGLRWTRDGITARVHASSAQIDPHTGVLAWTVDLHQGDQITLSWSLQVSDQVLLLVPAEGPPEWTTPTITASDPRLAQLVGRALDDIASLRLSDVESPEDVFIGAGVPWFLTLFGRDSLWAARMMLPLGTELAEGTLRTLANRQGAHVNVDSCEEPGKIMHELRRDNIWAPPTSPGDSGPMVYYGTVDATLLWISLLAEAWRWGMRDQTVTAFIPSMRRALTWLADYGDPTGQGFISYLDRTGKGLSNQGWKDSGTSVRFRNGALARPPIALCEVQGYAHRAALDAAELLDAFDGGAEADRWRSYAASLAARFRERFWVDGLLGAQPAMALDGDGRPVDSLTSNIGHLLGTGLLSPSEESQVARLIGSSALSGGYGLRTMSALDAAYDAMSYHCGGIWPFDTAIALHGLAAMGNDEHARRAATQLASQMLAAAEAFDYRLPELYGGDARSDVGRPLPHPAACRPQAWSATAAISLLQSVLGLNVSVPGTISAQPLQGLGFSEISVTGLRYGGQPMDVLVDASGNAQVTARAIVVPRQMSRESSIESSV